MTLVSEIRENRRPPPNASIPIRRLANIPAEQARRFLTTIQMQCMPADNLQMIRFDYCQYILHQTMQLSLHQLQ
jgi:hypothetical protein